jgi:hypothetical protein
MIQEANMNHETMTYKGKAYGFWVYDGNVEIRSESNPAKTPYLKQGSKMYEEIKAVILSTRRAI